MFHKTHFMPYCNYFIYVLMLSLYIEPVNPKDAKEAAKRLVESGVCYLLCTCVNVP